MDNEAPTTRIPVSTPEEIGRLARAARQAEAMRLDDAAGAIGVSDVFLWKLEKGAGGIRLDKLLQVLHGLGIRLAADVSHDAARRYELLRTDGETGTGRKSKPGGTRKGKAASST